MLKSVYENGGFYIGKYEVGIKEDIYRFYGTDYYTEHPTTAYTPVIQENKRKYKETKKNTETQKNTEL